MNNSLHILSSLADPGCHPAGLAPDLLQEIPNTIGKSLARALAWGTPPNWSVQGWAEELRQIACLAALEALRDSPDTAEVMLGAFLYQRVISKVRHHARREWRFALPLSIPAGQDTAPLEEVLSPAPTPDQHALRRELLVCVSALPSHQRNLLVRLFWLDSTELQEAKALGLSQSAVNRRKRSVVMALRRSFGETASSQPIRRRGANRTHNSSFKLTGAAHKNPNPRNTTYRKAVEGLPGKEAPPRGTEQDPPLLSTQGNRNTDATN